MRWIVTGGAGFIGSHLVEALVSRGDDVIVVDNFHTGTPKNIVNGVKTIQGSVKEVMRIKEKVDGIFHLGVFSSSPMYREDKMLVAKAIEDFIHLMEWSNKNNTKIVFASTSSIYNGNPVPWRENMNVIPTDFYTEARYAMERIASVYHQHHNNKIIALRLFSIYGEREEHKGKYANLVSQFIWSMLRDEQPIIYGDGNQTRDFVYVKDVVKAFITAMESSVDFGVFNVGTGKNYSLNELVKMLNEELEKNIEPKYVENPIKNYVYHTLADTTLSKEVLGFEAKTSLKEGIRKIIPYYKRVMGIE